MRFRQIVSLVARGLFSWGQITDVWETVHLNLCCTQQEGTVSSSKRTEIPFGDTKKWRLESTVGQRKLDGWWRAFGTGRRSMNHAALRGAGVLFLALFIGLQCCRKRMPAFHSNQYLTETGDPAKDKHSHQSVDPAENYLSFVVVALNKVF